MPDSTTNPQDSFLDRMQRNPSPKSDLTSGIIRLSSRKVLASKLFPRSSRQSRFLRFTVEETLAGRGPDLEQYVIGLKVFDRTHSFDPQSDPIVRIAAMRLRAKLNAYYETEGREDSIVIEFPRVHAGISMASEKPGKTQVVLVFD